VFLKETDRGTRSWLYAHLTKQLRIDPVAGAFHYNAPGFTTYVRGYEIDAYELEVICAMHSSCMAIVKKKELVVHGKL
jgi:hypothetical protein